MEAIEIILTLWCALALGLVLHNLHANDRKALERAERTHRAMLDALGRAGIAPAAAPAYRGLQRLPLLKTPPMAHRLLDAPRDTDTSPGALVTVEFSSGERRDSPSDRWLAQVLSASRAANARPNDDTPPPPGQRTPILPPPSSSGLRHRQE